MDSISSKLKLENKELIHIVAEVVIFFGLVFYFSSQNKKLCKHIEDLSESLEEQTTKCTELEEKLKKTELRLNQLSQYCSQSLGELSSMMKEVQTKQVLAQAFETVRESPKGLPKDLPKDVPKVSQKSTQPPPTTEQKKPQPVAQPVIEPLPKVTFDKSTFNKGSFDKGSFDKSTILESDSESESSEDELLDQEISEELSELQNPKK